MNNQNATFNNMFNPNAMPETKDSSPNNVGATPNNLQPTNQMNFSMPSTTSEIQNSNANAGSFSFVNPSEVGGNIANLNNDQNNLVGNSMNQNLNIPPVNKSDTQNMNQNNNQTSPLGFGLNNNASMPSSNQSLINTGISLNDANNNLLNNSTPVNNNLSNVNVSNDLVSSGLPNNGVVPVGNNYDSMVSKGEITPVKTYLLNMLLFCVPLVGFIMLIVKAVSKEESNIRNLARAYLILSLIVGVISTVLMFVALAPILALITG